MVKLLTTFSRNDRGSIAVLFTVALTLICACVGGAVDFARYSSAKSQTVAAVDAAVLAGARTLLLGGDSLAAVSAATTYYNENVTSRFGTVNDTVSFQTTQNDTVMTGSGSADLPTTFLRVVGIETLPLISEPAANFPRAQINGTGGNIEVSVMLDLTGSMCNDGKGPCTTGVKIDALKTAAKDLVNIVVRDDQSTYKSRVALVPFARHIRVAPNGQGAGIMKALTDLDATWSGWTEKCTNYVLVGTGAEGNEEWDCTSYVLEQATDWKIRPCVTERFFENPYGIDITDDAPGNNVWLNGYEGRRRPLSNDSASNPPTSGLGATSTDPAEHYNYHENGYCGAAEENELVPLSSDKTAINARIDAFMAEHQTAGALGTAFAWYMLSPNWNTIWPTGGADPYANMTMTLPSGAPKLRKVAILMSDGVYNSYRSWEDQDQQEVSNYAKAVCTAMKAAGIEIFTVGFDLDSLPAAEQAIALDTLQSCGTDIEHFYNTLDAGELQTAFRDIAVKLSTIALTQ